MSKIVKACFLLLPAKDMSLDALAEELGRWCYPCRAHCPVTFVDLGPAPRVTALKTRWLRCKCQASRSHNFSGTTTQEFCDYGWPSTRTSRLKYSIWIVYVIGGKCGLAGSKKKAEFSQSVAGLLNLAAQRLSFLILGAESTKCTE